MDTLYQLAQTTVFSSIPPTGIQKIKELAISRRYLNGEFVTHKSDVWPYLLFVKSGEIQALKESIQGRSFVIEIFKPGDIFWGLALFENSKQNPAAIRVSIEGELLLWHKDRVEDIVAAHPQVAWGLFALLAQKMGRIGEIVEELVFQPLTGRLANLLLGQFDEAEKNVISRDLTLDDMGARIGTTREMVCKILYQFSDNDIIDIRRTELKINDRASLKKIASKMKG